LQDRRQHADGARPDARSACCIATAPALGAGRGGLACDDLRHHALDVGAGRPMSGLTCVSMRLRSIASVENGFGDKQDKCARRPADLKPAAAQRRNHKAADDRGNRPASGLALEAELLA
jgi:hypothetical protein